MMQVHEMCDTVLFDYYKSQTTFAEDSSDKGIHNKVLRIMRTMFDTEKIYHTSDLYCNLYK